MHGRRKKDVISAADRAKEEKLVKAAFAATDQLIKQKQKRQEEAETDCTGKEAGGALQFTEKLLSANCEFVPGWNFRRGVLQTSLPHLPLRKDRLGLIESELSFLERLLPTQPKAYCLWYHRLWTLKLSFSLEKSKTDAVVTGEVGKRNGDGEGERKTAETDPSRDGDGDGDGDASAPTKESRLLVELELCRRFLARDSRNFHCWNHRQWVAAELHALGPESAARVEEADFSFTTTLIEENFSNYSAWHLRSVTDRLAVAVPWGQQTACTPGGNGNAVTPSEELDFLWPGLYTDPSDQSLWQYFAWLLHRRGGLGLHLLSGWMGSAGVEMGGDKKEGSGKGKGKEQTKDEENKDNCLYLVFSRPIHLHSLPPESQKKCGTDEDKKPESVSTLSSSSVLVRLCGTRTEGERGPGAEEGEDARGGECHIDQVLEPVGAHLFSGLRGNNRRLARGPASAVPQQEKETPGAHVKSQLWRLRLKLSEEDVRATADAQSASAPLSFSVSLAYRRASHDRHNAFAFVTEKRGAAHTAAGETVLCRYSLKPLEPHSSTESPHAFSVALTAWRLLADPAGVPPPFPSWGELQPPSPARPEETEALWCLQRGLAAGLTRTLVEAQLSSLDELLQVESDSPPPLALSARVSLRDALSAFCGDREGAMGGGQNGTSKNLENGTEGGSCENMESDLTVLAERDQLRLGLYREKLDCLKVRSRLREVHGKGDGKSAKGEGGLDLSGLGLRFLSGRELVPALPFPFSRGGASRICSFSLSLANNQLSAFAPDAALCFRTVQLLHVENNKFVSLRPFASDVFPILESLWADGNPLTDEFVGTGGEREGDASGKPKLSKTVGFLSLKGGSPLALGMRSRAGLSDHGEKEGGDLGELSSEAAARVWFDVVSSEGKVGNLVL
uniref:Geranylgeranyl transferase type-2 subunit alpha n=1 Tax=Chromera velia CCMP2878 TaxID=1169474 RepID=A0A0G4GMX9_9ALVE|eukprot:Cvel_4934.t1-p1 / transcript=Cvel_4934.t1 / gene=Cvel_4934 / organism=Chromera_velia_CCMP2878 / gene_product=Geranylgeranyl transferase type-2 subunit alpha, putative / transcript_product=Geranylgeranyl transferase type-2 subunit alpha, putative / location=Cvel_scaffold223:25001-28579(-) / protein_length=902 / sequence_SO=supercontig / SO=protein_coding / is_pseudo=false